MFYTTGKLRRSAYFVRLRANKIKYEALILPGLSVPHLLFLSTKKGAASQKCSPFFKCYPVSVYGRAFPELPRFMTSIAVTRFSLSVMFVSP